MPLTLHHMGKSQSERVLWLLEELQLPYTLTVHERDPLTGLGPDTLKSVHPAGTAPVLFDDEPNPNNAHSALAESGACVEYILATYAPDSTLVKKPGQSGYADYLTWKEYANGTLQPTIGRLMMFSRLNVDPQQPMYQFVVAKLDKGLKALEAQLTQTGAYLAGEELTAADIMNFFSLTTMRGFYPVDLTGYPRILEYFQRASERDAYKRTMEKGDKGLKPLLDTKVEKFDFGPHRKAEA